MSKVQAAYDKTVDLLLGLVFNFWYWLGGKLEVFPLLEAAPYVTHGDLDLIAELKIRAEVIEELTSKLAKLAPTKGVNRPNAKKLTQAEVANVRAMKRVGYSQAEIADTYDVNPATISRIVRGIYYGRKDLVKA